MCLKLLRSLPYAMALAVGFLAPAVRPAVADEARLVRAPTPSPALSAFSGGTLTIGHLTPAYGAVSLGLSSASLLTTRTLNGGGIGLAPIGASFTAPLSLLGEVSRVGLFGAYDERPSVLALSTATSWNFGASVGYAGFYLRGGVNESDAIGPLLGIQGLQAGFGYEIGALDLRLSYLASQGVGVGATDREIDSRQWAIGGIYQISPRIRLNADAFYGVGDGRSAPLAVVPPLTSPPGTGARVGVELRF